MHIATLYLVSILHLLFILFIIGVPIFSNDICLLFLHSIVVPFMMLHWYLNDNMCVLTILEQNIRKKIYGNTHKKDDCFTCKIIEPIYDFNKSDNQNEFEKIIYLITIMLWFGSLYKLYNSYNNGKITHIMDLFYCKY